MKTSTLTPELLHNMDAYWRAANYLSVGQIYLYDNPLLGGHWLSPILSTCCWGIGVRLRGRTSYMLT